jgi:hypothetical protein
MKPIKPEQLWLEAQLAVGRTGVLKTLLVALIAASFVGVGWLLVFAHDHVTTLDRAIAAAMVEVAPQKVPARPAGGAEANLAAYYRTLGDPNRAEDYLRQIFHLAAAANVEVDKGEYKWQFDKASDIFKYQLDLPVKGSYPAVRQFCESVLAGLPHASLDEMAFKRETIQDTQPEVRLRFTLYMSGLHRAEAFGKRGP